MATRRRRHAPERRGHPVTAHVPRRVAITGFAPGSLAPQAPDWSRIGHRISGRARHPVGRLRALRGTRVVRSHSAGPTTSPSGLTRRTLLTPAAVGDDTAARTRPPYGGRVREPPAQTTFSTRWRGRANGPAGCTRPRSEVTLLLEERVLGRVLEIAVLDLAGCSAQRECRSSGSEREPCGECALHGSALLRLESVHQHARVAMSLVMGSMTSSGCVRDVLIGVCAPSPVLGPRPLGQPAGRSNTGPSAPVFGSDPPPPTCAVRARGVGATPPDGVDELEGVLSARLFMAARSDPAGSVGARGRGRPTWPGRP